MRAVLVDQNGSVVQAVELAADWQTSGSPNYWMAPDSVTVVIDPDAGIGWTYAGGVFTAPPENVVAPTSTAVPSTVAVDPITVLQAALIAKGVITQADVTATATRLAAQPISPTIGVTS